MLIPILCIRLGVLRGEEVCLAESWGAAGPTAQGMYVGGAQGESNAASKGGGRQLSGLIHILWNFW